MSEAKKLITRWSRDFQGNLQEDPNGSWVLAADAAIRDKRLMDKIDQLQLRLTAADELADTMGGLLRLARGAIGENQWTLLTKDIDTMLSQDAGRTNNSRNAHCPHDGICHTSQETCAEAQARIASLTAPAGAGP